MAEILDPDLVFRAIALDVPADLHPHVVIIGSMAAAYQFRGQLQRNSVNTKDADLMIQPAGAVAECRRIAERLRKAGWTPCRQTGKECYPSVASEPVDALRIIRLVAPGPLPYFIELLAIPPIGQNARKGWIPLQLEDGWYVLPSFRYLGVTAQDTLRARNGLRYAAPEMMALANLLSHPALGETTISEPIAGVSVLRSAKDLGRVLALARLTPLPELERWPEHWAVALRERFPEEAAVLARRAGDGLRQLLSDSAALDQALLTCNVGLLAGLNASAASLRAVGEQVLSYALDPLARDFAETAHGQ